MNVYDFDNTIYSGDSTKDFCRFCMRWHLSAVWRIAVSSPAIFGYMTGKLTKTETKQRLYSFLRTLSDVDRDVSEFWKQNEYKISPWYREKKTPDDVVISASPEFLLKPVCEKLGIETLIASRVDKNTGIYDGLNCHGEEKLKRYRQVFGDREISEFYSDSLSDAPLAEIAQKAFLVEMNRIMPWPNGGKKQ